MKAVTTTGIQPKAVATVAEVYAVRACINGDANADQQKLAMNWIMREASRVTDLSYAPGDVSQTMFNEGRRYAGMCIRYCLDPLFLADAAQHDEQLKRQTK